MARTRKAYRNAPLACDDVDESPDSSSSFEDEDEERAVGSGGTSSRRAMHSVGKMTGKKRWTMRSQGKGYKSADVHSDTESPPLSDDDPDGKAYADGGRGAQDHPGSDLSNSSGDDRRGKKKKKRGGVAAAAAQAEQEAQEAQRHKTKMLYWVAGAVAIIVVLLIVGLIYWWSHRNSSDSKSSSASSSSSSSSATSSAASSPTSALATTSSAPASSSPSAVEPVGSSLAPTSAATAASRSHAVTSAKPSSTSSPSSTASALEADTTYAAQIQWLYAAEDATECGTQPTDGDYVVKVSPEVYGSTSGVSSVCGTWITLYQLEKDAYTRATIEGVCAECTGHNLILSQATFNALTQDMKLGTTLAQFWLTDDAHKPKASLSSAAAGAGTTGRASADAGGAEEDEDEGGRFTTLPVETDRAVAANGAASMGV
ncbi:hypothetical protein JCM8208_005871 [Rhodotorula glutinis]